MDLPTFNNVKLQDHKIDSRIVLSQSDIRANNYFSQMAQRIVNEDNLSVLNGVDQQVISETQQVHNKRPDTHLPVTNPDPCLNLDQIIELSMEIGKDQPDAQPQPVKIVSSHINNSRSQAIYNFPLPVLSKCGLDSTKQACVQSSENLKSSMYNTQYLE